MKSTSHYLIRNVRLWGQTNSVCLEVQNGILQTIQPQSETQKPSSHTIDGLGGTILPAGVDPQVHLRVPGQPEKETAKTGLQAAMSGGIAALLTMPNTKPVIDTVEVCELAKRELQEAQEETGVTAYLSAAISMGQKGKEPVDFKKLAKWGVRAFTDDGVGVVSDDIMRLAFAASAETGLPILQHAEFPGHGGVLAASSMQEKLHVKSYPQEAESEMVARDIALLKHYPGARYHVLHVSSHQTLELVERAKEKGLKVTCEVSPHHLMFSCDDINENDTSFKMNPPLRTDFDRQALRKALQSGVCDFVATDHAPHETNAKKDFKTSAYGTTGLETSLRALLTLWAQGELSTERLVTVFSTGPAHFLGIDDRFGHIQVGKTFNAVLIDDHSPAEVFAKYHLRSLSRNNCFVGSLLVGRVRGIFLESKSQLF